MKVTRQELLELWNALGKFKSVKNAKFIYFLAKNRENMKKEIDYLTQSGIIPEKYREYDRKRSELAKSYADLDETGKPMVVDKNYKITKNLEVFNLQLENLKVEYKDTLEEFKKVVDKYSTVLNETVEFTGYKISTENLPDLNLEIMEKLIKYDLIIDQ